MEGTGEVVSETVNSVAQGVNDIIQETTDG